MHVGTRASLIHWLAACLPRLHLAEEDVDVLDTYAPGEVLLLFKVHLLSQAPSDAHLESINKLIQDMSPASILVHVDWIDSEMDIHDPRFDSALRLGGVRAFRALRCEMMREVAP